MPSSEFARYCIKHFMFNSLKWRWCHWCDPGRFACTGRLWCPTAWPESRKHQKQRCSCPETETDTCSRQHGSGKPSSAFQSPNPTMHWKKNGREINKTVTKKSGAFWLVAFGGCWRPLMYVYSFFLLLILSIIGLKVTYYKVKAQLSSTSCKALLESFNLTYQQKWQYLLYL